MADQENVDVVVFGATGFTGQLISAYLASHPTQPSFALAGRSPTKLAAAQAKLSKKVPIIVADVADQASLAAMVQRTRVVINVIGPFSLHNARAVVAECVKQSRNYVDLTGESRFYADTVREFDQLAQDNGSVIIPSAGFDSVPFDLTTFLATQEAKRLSKQPGDGQPGVTDVYCSLRLKGGLSKGTLLSALEMARTDNPATIVPRTGEKLTLAGWEMKPVQADILSPRSPPHVEHPIPTTLATPAPGFGPDQIMSLFAFSLHNHRIVNRTWGLLGSSRYNYGDKFQYHDGPVVAYRWLAWIMTFITLVTPYLLVYFPPLVWAIKALPDKWATPGTGPSGFLDLRTVAVSETGEKAITYFNCRGDPGYFKTATLISEAALTTLEPAEGRIIKAGVLTTVLLGPKFPERLVKYGDFNIVAEAYDPVVASKYKAF